MAVTRGQIPPELTKEAQGGEVHVDMEDHREEEFVRERVAARPFQGEDSVPGHRELQPPLRLGERAGLDRPGRGAVCRRLGGPEEGAGLARPVQCPLSTSRRSSAYTCSGRGGGDRPG
jgi:hypothetical protein